MSEPAEELIDRLVDELEHGREPDLAALAERFPGQAHKLEGYLEAARRVLSQFPASRLGSLPQGARLGDFEVQSVLASGGMGTVYEARQITLDRPVALKVLGANLSPLQQRRFENEAKLLAPIHHPGLAEIFGFGEDARGSYIAMELVEGTTLADVLRGGGGAVAGSGRGKAVRRIVTWGLEVAQALAAIHVERLVHRDVKPANIVIEQDGTGDADGLPAGRAVLVDFGLVRDLDAAALTRTSEAAMTWEYAAPEQIEGAEADPAMDTFSLGVSLYDLLAGQVPEERARASGGLPSLAPVTGIDRDLAAVIDKATRPEVRWRYPNGAALASDLGAWLEGRPVAARRPPLAERMVRGVRRHPGRVLGALAGATGVLALAVALAWALAAVRARGAVVAAHGGGDLRAFDRSLDELPLPWSLALLPEPVQRDAGRLRSAAEDEPLAAATRAWTEGRDLEALRVAATQLRREGAAAEPLLLRFLVGILDGIEGAPTRDQADALRLLCRVYHEREVQGGAEFAASADLRARLMALFRAPGLGEALRYWTLTGLSGCGGAGEAAWMLGLAEEPGLNVEQLRMVLFCARRILLRGAEEKGTALLVEMAERGRRLAERYGGLTAETSDDPSELLLAQVALDLGVLTEDLGGGAGSAAEILGPGARGIVAAHRPSFHGRGAAYWSALLPDADTHLGAGAMDAAGGALALPEGRVGDAPAQGLVAAWDFAAEAIGGSAQTPTLFAAAIDSSGRFGSRLRFGSFGHSAVELPFRVEEAYPGDLTLVLTQLAARRSYLLHGGEAHLVIELDGRLLAELHEVDHLPAEHHVRVFRRLLTAGDHRLVVRSGRDSSTTYWLYRAELYGRN